MVQKAQKSGAISNVTHSTLPSVHRTGGWIHPTTFEIGWIQMTGALLKLLYSTSTVVESGDLNKMTND
jgi:hypothetical protein